MTLESNEAGLIEDLAILPGHHERLAYAIEKFGGKTPPTVDEKTEGNLLPGCTSQLWLAGGASDGVMQIRVASDSPMVDGLASLLASIVNGCPATEVAAAPDGMPRVLAESGIDRALTSTRQRGMTILWAAIRAAAARG